MDKTKLTKEELIKIIEKKDKQLKDNKVINKCVCK